LGIYYQNVFWSILSTGALLVSWRSFFPVFYLFNICQKGGQNVRARTTKEPKNYYSHNVANFNNGLFFVNVDKKLGHMGQYWIYCIFSTVTPDWIHNGFLLGVYAYSKGWYRKNNWKPNLIVLGAIGVNIVIFSLFWSMMIKWGFNETINKIMNAILYNTITIVLTLFLTGLFHKFQNKIGGIISWFLPYSYEIYWLHLIVLTVILKMIKPINIAGVIKWSLSIIFTLIICQIISKYIINQIKCKIFKK
jgi:hypothetical protein